MDARIFHSVAQSWAFPWHLSTMITSPSGCSHKKGNSRPILFPRLGVEKMNAPNPFGKKVSSGTQKRVVQGGGGGGGHKKLTSEILKGTPKKKLQTHFAGVACI